MKEHVDGEFAIKRRLESEIGRGSAAAELMRPVLNKCDRPVLAAMVPTVEGRIPTRSRSSTLFEPDVQRFEVVGLRTASEAPMLTGPLHAWVACLLDTRTVHRITLSACSSSDCGTLTPSAFAVLRLITNSNLIQRGFVQ
jgi:hypothetical protein